MSSHVTKSEITWPDLDSSYVDEFGFIDQAVYEVARKVWPAVVPSILRSLRDLHAGQTVMLKAAALVSRKLGDDSVSISNLYGYLYRTFSRALRDEAEKEGKHAELNQVMLERDDVDYKQSDQSIHKRILIHQILERADPDTRSIFELLLLGHTLEEIAKTRGMASNRLRKNWSQEIRRLTAAINAEMREAERKALNYRSVQISPIDPSNR